MQSSLRIDTTLSAPIYPFLGETVLLTCRFEMTTAHPDQYAEFVRLFQPFNCVSGGSSCSCIDRTSELSSNFTFDRFEAPLVHRCGIANYPCGTSSGLDTAIYIHGELSMILLMSLCVFVLTIYRIDLAIDVFVHLTIPL